jgi:transposase-like protein
MGLLTYKEAAARLGVAPATLRVQSRRGRLPVTIHNRRAYIDDEALENYARYQREARPLKVILQDILQGTLLKPDGVPEDDWKFMIYYARKGVSMDKVARHYGVSRQRVEQRIRHGLIAAGAKGLDKAPEAL